MHCQVTINFVVLNPTQHVELQLRPILFHISKKKLTKEQTRNLTNDSLVQKGERIGARGQEICFNKGY